MTNKEMIKIIEEKRIDSLNEEDKGKVMSFAFGEEFMSSNNKGEKVKLEVDNEEWSITVFHN